jgi:hypothetical protein
MPYPNRHSGVSNAINKLQNCDPVTPCVREVVVSSEIHLRGPKGRGYGILTRASRTCSSKNVDEWKDPTADSFRNRCRPIHNTKMAA